MKIPGLVYTKAGNGEPPAMGENKQENSGSKLFPPTRWSLVSGSRSAETGGRERALSELCEIYWFPVYAYIRSMDRSHHDTQDLVQGFFASILRRGDFARADRDRGRLRTFLCVAAKRFVISSDRKGASFKRGGGTVTVSMDAEKVEFLYRNAPCESLTPETSFDRHWATAVLEEATGRLRLEYEARGKGDLFAVIQPYLGSNARDNSQGDRAAKLGMGIGAFRMSVSRMRQRYGEILRETVADTLTDPSGVDEEIGYLLRLFSR